MVIAAASSLAELDQLPIPGLLVVDLGASVELDIDFDLVGRGDVFLCAADEDRDGWLTALPGVEPGAVVLTLDAVLDAPWRWRSPRGRRSHSLTDDVQTLLASRRERSQVLEDEHLALTAELEASRAIVAQYEQLRVEVQQYADQVVALGRATPSSRHSSSTRTVTTRCCAARPCTRRGAR